MWQPHRDSDPPIHQVCDSYSPAGQGKNCRGELQRCGYCRKQRCTGEHLTRVDLYDLRADYVCTVDFYFCKHSKDPKFPFSAPAFGPDCQTEFFKSEHALLSRERPKHLPDRPPASAQCSAAKGKYQPCEQVVNCVGRNYGSLCFNTVCNKHGKLVNGYRIKKADGLSYFCKQCVARTQTDLDFREFMDLPPEKTYQKNPSRVCEYKGLHPILVKVNPCGGRGRKCSNCGKYRCEKRGHGIAIDSPDGYLSKNKFFCDEKCQQEDRKRQDRIEAEQREFSAKKYPQASLSPAAAASSAAQPAYMAGAMPPMPMPMSAAAARRVTPIAMPPMQARMSGAATAREVLAQRDVELTSVEQGDRRPGSGTHPPIAKPPAELPPISEAMRRRGPDPTWGFDIYGTEKWSIACFGCGKSNESNAQVCSGCGNRL